MTAARQLSLLDLGKLTPAGIAAVSECGPIVFTTEDGKTVYTVNGSYFNKWVWTPKGWECVDCRPTGNGFDGLYTLPMATAMERAEAWHREGYALDEDEASPAPAPPVAVAPVAARKPRRAAAPKPARTFETELTDRQRELLDLFSLDGNQARYTETGHVPDWAEVKKVFVALGARWAKGAFRFPDDVDGAAKVRLAIETGAILDPRKAGFFPTPADLAWRLVQMAEVTHGTLALEPSAGRGGIAYALRMAGAIITCVEVLPENAAALRRAAFDVHEMRFQDFHPAQRFDAIVMNPPFASDPEGDIGHVERAIGMLASRGRLVAILSGGVRYRETARHQAFRALVDGLGATWEGVPHGAFAESGTNVSTCILKVRKP